MLNKILFANALIILAQQVRFFFYLYKTNKSSYLEKIIKYSIYSFACFNVCGYVGTLFYIIIASNIVMQLFKTSKNVIYKLVITAFVMYLYVYNEDYTFINNIPFLVLISYIWLRPYFKKLNNKYLVYCEKILMIIYAYYFKLYMLSLVILYELLFNIITKYFKKYISFVNKRIN